MAHRVSRRDEFLARFFETVKAPRIMQVGANDGIQSDFLRRHIAKPTSPPARILLVEPLPFYAGKLKLLYRDRPDVLVAVCACGEQSGKLTLYSIPPVVADEMDGDGPQNRWAHGQGSFSEEIVKEWIEKNAFRGARYRSRIPFYQSQISTCEVQQKRVSALLDEFGFDGLDLLVVDVQGFEANVLRGVDFSRRPKVIIYEFDRDPARHDPCEDILLARDYRKVISGLDMVWVHRSEIALLGLARQGVWSWLSRRLSRGR